MVYVFITFYISWFIYSAIKYKETLFFNQTFMSFFTFFVEM